MHVLIWRHLHCFFFFVFFSVFWIILSTLPTSETFGKLLLFSLSGLRNVKYPLPFRFLLHRTPINFYILSFLPLHIMANTCHPFIVDSRKYGLGSHSTYSPRFHKRTIWLNPITNQPIHHSVQLYFFKLVEYMSSTNLFIRSSQYSLLSKLRNCTYNGLFHFSTIWRILWVNDCKAC